MNIDGSHSHMLGYPLDEGKHDHPHPPSWSTHHVHAPDPVAIVAFIVAMMALFLALRR